MMRAGDKRAYGSVPRETLRGKLACAFVCRTTTHSGRAFPTPFVPCGTQSTTGAPLAPSHALRRRKTEARSGLYRVDAVF
jgi:hypothetical protein